MCAWTNSMCFTCHVSAISLKIQIISNLVGNFVFISIRIVLVPDPWITMTRTSLLCVSSDGFCACGQQHAFGASKDVPHWLALPWVSMKEAQLYLFLLCTFSRPKIKLKKTCAFLFVMCMSDLLLVERISAKDECWTARRLALFLSLFSGFVHIVI